ncbi:MAG: HAD hydrolase-like protein [Clostridia bacterium]|nr:HAD hydrolase-like protein [Clostridia bacterium]MBQ9919356.1 HAD hydrolase-like protein [Clostridia bacterium]
MNFDTILFDLDGTLTDPAEGITNSVIYALKKMGIAPPERKELLKFIGPPLAQSFEKYFNLSYEQSLKAVDIYREYFAPKGLFENTLFDGVPEMLKSLKKGGKKIVLATSKPTVFANEILKHFNLYDFFDLTVGSNLDGSLTNKAEVITVALERLGNIKKDRAVMVGDRSHDVIGGIKNGLFTVGVTFGYGSEEELKAAGASHIVNSVKELTEFLI